MTHWRTMTCAALMTVALAQLAAQGGLDVELQRVREQATITGDLRAAIANYQRIFERAGEDRAVASKALLWQGESFEKLRNAQAARTMYARVIREFSDQREAARTASQRLSAMSGSAGQVSLGDRKALAGSDFLMFNSITPDGRFMAVAGDRTAGLSVRDLLSDAVTPIIERPAPAFFPILSPSQKQLVYLDVLEKAICIVANKSAAEPKILIRTDRTITDVWPRGWSQDEQSVLVELQRADKTWQFAWVSTNDRSIKPLRSLEWRRPGGPERRVSFSPDGRFITYAALAHNPVSPTAGPGDSTDSHIYVFALDGSTETEVTKSAGVDETPVWTPDGSHILFVSNRAGSVDLWAVAVQEGKPAGSPVPVKNGFGHIVPIGMTRAGTFYYTSASPSSNAPVQVGEIDVSGAHQAAGANWTLMASRRRNPSVAVSPDGKLVAFLRETGAAPITTNEPPMPDIVIHTLATGQETGFAVPGRGTLAAVMAPLLWSHDGKSIIVSRRDTSPSLLPKDGAERFGNPPFTVIVDRLDAKTGRVTEQASLGGSITFSALSPDDQTLYGLDGTTRGQACVVAFDFSTRQKRQVACGPTARFSQDLSLSPDGRVLGFFTGSGSTQRGVARVNIDGSDYREIFQMTVPPNSGVSVSSVLWTPDSHAVLFAAPDGSMQPRIMRLDAGGGTPQFTGVQPKGFVSLVGGQGPRPFVVTRDDSTVTELRAIDNVTNALTSVR